MAHSSPRSQRSSVALRQRLRQGQMLAFGAKDDYDYPWVSILWSSPSSRHLQDTHSGSTVLSCINCTSDSTRKMSRITTTSI